MTVLEQLDNFIKESEAKFLRNLWLEDDDMKVYVRKGRHILGTGQNAVITLDIATVEVNEGKQNQGIWTNFLYHAHEMNPWDATYIENILNPILSVSLVKNGWIPVIKPGLYSECYYMPKDSFYNLSKKKNIFNVY